MFVSISPCFASFQRLKHYVNDKSGEAGGWGKLRSKELYNLNSPPHILKMNILGE
jgi:hypothetical protein